MLCYIENYRHLFLFFVDSAGKMVVGEASIHNIMGGMESTGGVRLHNHKRKLKQRYIKYIYIYTLIVTDFNETQSVFPSVKILCGFKKKRKSPIVSNKIVSICN